MRVRILSRRSCLGPGGPRMAPTTGQFLEVSCWANSTACHLFITGQVQRHTLPSRPVPIPPSPFSLLPAISISIGFGKKTCLGLRRVFVPTNTPQAALPTNLASKQLQPQKIPVIRSSRPTCADTVIIRVHGFSLLASIGNDKISRGTQKSRARSSALAWGGGGDWGISINTRGAESSP